MSHTESISDKMTQTWAEEPTRLLIPPLPLCQTKQLYLGERRKEGEKRIALPGFHRKR